MPEPFISRRDFLSAAGTAAAASIAASLVPSIALAQTRAAPPIRSRSLPAIGLGTFMTFDVLPGQPRTQLADVVRRFWHAGGRVIDTSPLYGTGETNVGDFATSLGIGDRMFFANKIWSTGEYLGDDSHARRSLEQSMQRLWRERIDLLQCHSLTNVDVVVPLLQAFKKEGRIDYVGITHHDPLYFDALADWIARGNFDVVQVHYSIHARQAEDRILPAARDRGMAVFVNMPFEKARLFKLVENRPLPDFAREFGAENWAQFFLKWVISHPAVTCALPATSSPDHVLENMGALRGPLPDAALRTRMVQFMEKIPGWNTLQQMPWYPDKRYPGLIARAQNDLRARAQP